MCKFPFFAKGAICCVFFLLSIFANGQPTYILTDSTKVELKNKALLADHNYSFEQILADTTLPFITGDSLRPVLHNNYWIRLKIVNPSAYAQAYELRMRPFLSNTLYYFDANAQRWMQQSAGIMIHSKGQIYRGGMSCILRAKTTNILYVKVDVAAFKSIANPIEPKFLLIKQAISVRKEQDLWMAWVVGIAVLSLFLLNNIYIYFSFKERTILYFLIAQIGGMVYITTYWLVLYKFVFFRIYTMLVQANGNIYIYDANHLLMHVGVALVLYGMVKLTQVYLVTVTKLPKLNTLLKYGMYVYLLFSLVVALINTFWFHIEHITLVPDNILFLLVMATIVATCIVAYKHRFPAAGPFLFANVLPIAFMLGTALFHLFVDINGINNWLPLLSVLSQALGFSIAQVALTKYLRNNLQQKELEAQQLLFEIQEIDFNHKLIVLENKQISTEMLNEKNKNEILQQKLEVNQRELASTSLYMMQKNEMLAGLKKQVQELNEQYPDSKHLGLQSIASILQSNLHLDADWEKFRIHFEQVHPHFFEDLLTKYPSLTKNELRLYAYFHIKLSTKEIAALLNIDPASVRQAKTRLFKKIATA